ncbi:MAG: AAA family ATPase, partial [Desulfovibrionales bacterium]|nr:AAA family ATPase [Desulfovibrionales bacterium]
MKTLFFLGKGGTGKSTVACLSALTLADQGKSVVLVSLDDAHNLSDILGGGSRPWNIRGELVMVEVDRDREIRRFLARQTREIKASHTYLTAFNLDHHFNVLKHSPGMEVHALADAFGELRRKYASWDYLLVDMPPTALALHFFNLPSLSLVWLEQLEALRREIKEKKEIISRIKLGAKVVEQDRILTKIQELGTQHRELANFFRDTRGCQLLGVCNGDPLSRAESRRIMDGLASLDLSLGGLVL